MSAKHETHSPMVIRLDLLHTNDQFQPRFDGLNEAHVQILTGSEVAEWPPLLVTSNDDGGFDVVDGNHRLAAARRLGIESLACIVDPEAGHPEAVAANLRHGLPLSIRERKEYARWLKHYYPDLSFREIGRQCGLNHETVARALTPPADADAEEPGENRQPRPDLIRKLVRQVTHAYQLGQGRTFFGLGSAGSPKPFSRAIADYAEEDQPNVAKALHAFGEACIQAATPYLSD
jgi:ParB-like nuclease family protein